MSINQPDTFDRRFMPADVSLFRDLVAGMAGQPCVAWRKSYGRTGQLHFGSLVEPPDLPPKAVDRFEGEWIVNLDDADRVLRSPGGVTLDSRRDGDELLMASLRELEGATLGEIILDPSTLSLRLHMSDGHVLDLHIDGELPADNEQWAIELPNGLALIMYGDQRWSLEPNRPSGPVK